MSVNIYQINSWTASTALVKNDIVSNSNLFYYSATNFTTSSSINTDINNGNLIGYIVDNGEQKSYFFWKPSYRFDVQNEPKVKKINFGNSYTQRLKDGLSNNLPIINLEFGNIDIQECTAILHFLDQRGGSESFLFLPEAPLGNIGRFVCEKYNHTQNAFNNYSIRATFEQVVT